MICIGYCCRQLDMYFCTLRDYKIRICLRSLIYRRQALLSSHPLRILPTQGMHSDRCQAVAAAAVAAAAAAAAVAAAAAAVAVAAVAAVAAAAVEVAVAGVEAARLP